MNRILEICLDSVPSAIAARQGGADRIELCENLYQGGVTPSAGKIKLAKKLLDIPVFVLIRPRKGDFLYSETEFQTIIEDIHAAKTLGADGIVSGALLADGHIDAPRTRLMVEAAHPLPFTFHRAFDMCRDALRAIDELADCGVRRILTSGQQPDAGQGLENLRHFAGYAGTRISILACGKLMPDNIASLLHVSGIDEFHAALRREARSAMNWFGNVPMGDEAVAQEFAWHETDEEQVSRLRSALSI